MWRQLSVSLLAIGTAGLALGMLGMLAVQRERRGVWTVLFLGATYILLGLAARRRAKRQAATALHRETVAAFREPPAPVARVKADET